MEDFEPDTNLFAGNYNFQKLDITGSPTLWLDEFGKVYILNKHNAATDTTYLKCRQHTRARGTFFSVTFCLQFLLIDPYFILIDPSFILIDPSFILIDLCIILIEPYFNCSLYHFNRSLYHFNRSLYHFNRSLYHLGGCTATARIKFNTLHLGNKEHSCGTGQDTSKELKLLKTMMEMKLQAAETTDTLRDIYNRVLQNPNTDPYVRESLGYTDIEYNMRYIRRTKYPPVPKDMLEMIDALSGEHPFQDLFHGFVTFDDDKIAFLFADRELLNVVKGIFLRFLCVIS